MYQGPIGFLVPYFHSMNLNCPSYHNPADFGDASESLLVVSINIILYIIRSYGRGLWRTR